MAGIDRHRYRADLWHDLLQSRFTSALYTNTPTDSGNSFGFVKYTGLLLQYNNDLISLCPESSHFFEPKISIGEKNIFPPKIKKNVPYLMITFVITFTLQMFQHTETISAIIIITEKLDIRYSCYSLNKSSIK